MKQTTLVPLKQKKVEADSDEEIYNCPTFPHSFENLIQTTFHSQKQKLDENESIATGNFLRKREAQDMLLLFRNSVKKYFPSHSLSVVLFNALLSSEFENISLLIYEALQQIIIVHGECCQKRLWNGIETSFHKSKQNLIEIISKIIDDKDQNEKKTKNKKIYVLNSKLALSYLLELWKKNVLNATEKKETYFSKILNSRTAELKEYFKFFLDLSIQGNDPLSFQIGHRFIGLTLQISGKNSQSIILEQIIIFYRKSDIEQKLLFLSNFNYQLSFKLKILDHSLKSISILTKLSSSQKDSLMASPNFQKFSSCVIFFQPKKDFENFLEFSFSFFFYLDATLNYSQFLNNLLECKKSIKKEINYFIEKAKEIFKGEEKEQILKYWRASKELLEMNQE